MADQPDRDESHSGRWTRALVTPSGSTLNIGDPQERVAVLHKYDELRAAYESGQNWLDSH